MNQLDQILQLPFAYVWLPTLVFGLVAATVYWLWRPAPVVAEPAAPAVATPPSAPLAVKKPELRGTSRRQGNPVEVHVAAPDNKKNPGVGSVLDRSMGGMRLALFHEATIGAVVSIRPIQASEMVPWIDLEIRSCKPSSEMPGQFEVGCQYVKSPPYSIQLLFG